MIRRSQRTREGLGWSFIDRLSLRTLIPRLLLLLVGFIVGKRSCYNPVTTKEISPMLYGHIHMAKTAGSNINGYLAANFERVCGNKGYSYDSYQENIRYKRNQEQSVRQHDLVSRYSSWNHRAEVPKEILEEIGFEDCDFVSNERNWDFWVNFFANWKFPVELHLPCRDPVDHLMSICNHRGRTFDCNVQLDAAVDHCLSFMERFNSSLATSMNLKCFDYKANEEYIQYMSERLQPRKIPANFVKRETNHRRKKEAECIWKNPLLEKKLRRYMVDKIDYFSFCDQCMATKNNLFRK